MAQENERLPTFQRFEGNNAFIEGWALYAETLGYEMGLYDDPQQHWGTLDDEMLRAMRLVVDTGIHVKGWGELAHMGLNNAARKMDFAGQEARFGPLVNDMGMTLDDAANRAWEAGYFPDRTERPFFAAKRKSKGEK